MKNIFVLPALTIAFGLSTLAVSPSASAKLFSNSYISFELPPEWNCSQEGTEWVCISKLSKEAKEAMIILTAKEVGPSDSLAAYMNYLKQPRVLPAKTGAPKQSKVLQVTQRNISNHPWVDSLHLGSEVPSYYTRYLATVKDRIAILVTFSAHKPSYTRYSNDFIRAINSLRVTASKDILRASSAPGLSRNEQLGSAIPSAMPPPGQSLNLPPESGRSGPGMGLKQTLGYGLILLGVLVLAVWWFLLRKQKPKKRRPHR